ncbi:protein FAM200B-like [Portunus trituberculatus]|uniref:protein FAM200B-like n=1 Tax=Portunus trituberculatus TaxID=210409 RepID=UPI001E1CF1ED|nr:protein FAM200B-like [Portunus trituberculatus]
MAAVAAKKKCRQYSQEYLKYGFITSLSNDTMPLCLLCEKTFSNDAMKPAKMKDHLERVHSDKKHKDLDLYSSTLQFLADVDSSLCEELKKCKNALFYLADLYSKFNETQKRLQGKDVTIIQARTVLLGFQGKLGLFRASLARRDFQYFQTYNRYKVKKFLMVT